MGGCEVDDGSGTYIPIPIPLPLPLPLPLPSYLSILSPTKPSLLWTRDTYLTTLFTHAYRISSTPATMFISGLGLRRRGRQTLRSIYMICPGLILYVCLIIMRASLLSFPSLYTLQYTYSCQTPVFHHHHHQSRHRAVCSKEGKSLKV